MLLVLFSGKISPGNLERTWHMAFNRVKVKISVLTIESRQIKFCCCCCCWKSLLIGLICKTFRETIPQNPARPLESCTGSVGIIIRFHFLCVYCPDKLKKNCGKCRGFFKDVLVISPVKFNHTVLKVLVQNALNKQLLVLQLSTSIRDYLIWKKSVNARQVFFLIWKYGQEWWKRHSRHLQ